MTRYEEANTHDVLIPIADRLQRIRDVSRRLGRRQHVHILGAGVAGLTAALELQARGHRATIYEASNRIGGRILTQRLGPRPAQGEADTRPFVELGAMRVPDQHDYTFHYATGMLGLQRRLFLNNDRCGNAFYDLCGSQRPARRFAELVSCYNLTLPERELVERGGPGPLFGRIIQIEMRKLDADDPSWRDKMLQGQIRGAALERVDRISTGRALEEHVGDPSSPLSTGGLRLLADAGHLADYFDRALLLFIRDQLTNRGPLWELYKEEEGSARGGMDLLTTGLAAAVGHENIHLSCPVDSLTIEGRRWQVTFEKRPPLLRRNRDEQLLCTLPYAVLRHLRLRGLGAQKQAAIQHLDYVHSVKVGLTCRERFWQHGGKQRAIFGGRTIFDTAEGQMSRQTYYPNDHNDRSPCADRDGSVEEAVSSTLYTAPHAMADGGPEGAQSDERAESLGDSQVWGPGVLLASYVVGASARALAAHPDPIGKTIEDLRRVHPEIDRFVQRERSVSWYWNEQPHARGAFVLPAPGDVSRFFQNGLEPEGDVFFAGEHLSPAAGWIQGSISSALFAVEQQLRNAASVTADEVA